MPKLDKDLSVEEARRVMERQSIWIPDSFELVSMRRFGCPPLAGMCGYAGSYVAPAEHFPDHRAVHTDSTYTQPLQKITCAELTERLGFEPTPQRSANGWKFDCANAIEWFASSPYGDISPDYPQVTIVRDPQFATIHFYSRPS
ncbi:hypothetical protein ACFVJ5_05685 [Nocardia sp. NPDC127606]|uniref:hypothetical protein n=1 Tax=Nocardia sp. NPDC127606 TaxID=3345406 RepID=UPI0036251A12